VVLERIAGCYERVLAAMTEDSIGDARSEVEQRQIEEWNRTEVETPSGSAHELFERQVEKTPDAIAVTYGEGALSYAELNARGNRLAHYLRRSGVGPETRVGVCLERSMEMVVALVGILKAGGAYVPLDVEYSGERLVCMMEDAGVKIVVSQGILREKLPSQVVQFVPFVCLDGEAEREAIAAESGENLGVPVEDRQLAYVMYTSGSTGQPKGVEVEHGGIKHSLCNAGYVEWKRDGVMLQMTPIWFDAATFEIWGALLHGLRLVIAPRGLLALEQVGEILTSHGVTMMWLTGALFHAMVDTRKQDLAGVQQMLVGGDVLSRQHVGEYLKAGKRYLINGYGPTEATFTCCHRMRSFDESWRNVPIGRPIGNTQVCLVDREMEAVGVGVPGEICIGGLGLARGYGNNSELTAERFVPNRFGGGGERLYRTGDWGRWQEDGTIEFIGRRDEQVKIRGYRIELGDIEAQLEKYEGVQDAVVVAREDVPGETNLVAYYTVKGGGAEGDALKGEDLRHYLSQSFPDHLVPAGYVHLEKLPLTADGKLNRKELPPPVEKAFAVRGYEPPAGEIETMVAGIWAEVLQVPRVGRHDNFFFLGGRSLPAVQVAARVQQRMNVELTIREIFECPTPTLLAEQELEQLLEELES
jgi:amino acid adenylation domain-containing protein